MVRKCIASALALALVGGCALPGPLPMTRDADRQSACVSVRWSTPAQIIAACGLDPVSGRPNQACYLDGSIIVAPKPAGWGDEAALLSLGHELFHALGARHD